MHKNTISTLIKSLPENVRLIAASKTRAAETVQAAKTLGIQHFGENYVQEAEQKAGGITDVTWHLIGALQTNKVSKALQIFDVFHTVDREKLLNKLNSAAMQAGKTPDVFLQVNIGREPQKAGIFPEDLPLLVGKAQACIALNLVGLMAIPPANTPPAPYFAEMQKLAKTYNLHRLSMGMSTDWQEALTYGATDIRLGTALFGARSA
mgnify:CR=1 FL=1